MRAALVSPYALDVFGGVQSQVLGLAAALRGVGHEVLVVSPVSGAVAPDGVIGVGATVAVPVNGSRAPVSPFPSTARRARAVVEDFHPDVVHLHEPLVPGPCLGVLGLRGLVSVGTFHRADAGLLYPALRPLLAPFARRLGLRVAVSAAARETARRALGRRLEPSLILENAVDVDTYARAVPEPTEGPTVVFLGRHEQRKGLEIALRGFLLLPENFRFWVLGAGPQTERLHREYHDHRVRWLGALRNEEAAAFVKGADVLVAPSLGGESFGVVLLDAMAAGTAVVASDLPGYRDAGLGAARFVPPGSPEALAASVLELLGDPAQRLGLEEEGRRRASSHSFTELARRYLRCYEELLAR